MAIKKKLRPNEYLFFKDGSAIKNAGFRTSEIVLLSKQELDREKQQLTTSSLGKENDEQSKKPT